MNDAALVTYKVSTQQKKIPHGQPIISIWFDPQVLLFRPKKALCEAISESLIGVVKQWTEKERQK